MTSPLLLRRADTQLPGLPRASRLLPARLPAARAAPAQPPLEICALPAGFPLLSPGGKKAEQGAFADLEAEGDAAPCAAAEDVGRCRQPSPRSPWRRSSAPSAAPRLLPSRAPTQPRSPWVFRASPQRRLLLACCGCSPERSSGASTWFDSQPSGAPLETEQGGGGKCLFFPGIPTRFVTPAPPLVPVPGLCRATAAPSDALVP